MKDISPALYDTQQEIAWCPGCGNFGIREALRQALAELRLEPSRVVIVSGIGQAAKLGQYVRANLFDGLHGRALPAATGIRLANHNLKVIAIGGDGDMYAEGTNHLMHTFRRNIGVTCLVHNNQVFGLTRGQQSPTSDAGFKTATSPLGSLISPFNPLAFAVALDAGFVARGFSGDIERLKELLKQAIQFEGFSLLDVLQPCVTLNRVNTGEWYKSRVYYLDDKYDPTDRVQALARSLEWPAEESSGKATRIPLGIIYRSSRPNLESRIPQIMEKPLVEQVIALGRFRELIERHR